MMITLQQELGLGQRVIPQRIALTEDQVAEYDLPYNPDAFKPTDSRAQKFAEQFGEVGYELDAVKAVDLDKLCCQAIEDRFDMDEFNRQREIYADEDEKIDELREQVEGTVNDLLDELD